MQQLLLIRIRYEPPVARDFPAPTRSRPQFRETSVQLWPVMGLRGTFALSSGNR